MWVYRSLLQARSRRRRPNKTDLRDTTTDFFARWVWQGYYLRDTTTDFFARWVWQGYSGVDIPGEKASRKVRSGGPTIRPTSTVKGESACLIHLRRLCDVSSARDAPRCFRFRLSANDQ
jgi:hypothetical protein